MFSKTPTNSQQPSHGASRPETGSGAETSPAPTRRPGPTVASLISGDMTVEGNIVGGGEIQIDGVIKGDVRIERVTVGEGGQVEGGIFAEAVEVRGKVSGSITAKQVRLYGDCHVDGDITHEQLAMETGAFFQGRSLRLQRPAAAEGLTTSATRIPEPAPVAPKAAAPLPPRDNGSGLSFKPTSAP